MSLTPPCLSRYSVFSIDPSNNLLNCCIFPSVFKLLFVHVDQKYESRLYRLYFDVSSNQNWCKPGRTYPFLFRTLGLYSASSELMLSDELIPSDDARVLAEAHKIYMSGEVKTIRMWHRPDIKTHQNITHSVSHALPIYARCPSQTYWEVIQYRPTTVFQGNCWYVYYLSTLLDLLPEAGTNASQGFDA